MLPITDNTYHSSFPSIYQWSYWNLVLSYVEFIEYVCHQKMNSFVNYDKKKYKELIIDVAEIALGILASIGLFMKFQQSGP
jgi:hypothetical protein